MDCATGARGALLALGVAAMSPSCRSPERGVALGLAVYNSSTTVILGVAGVAGAERTVGQVVLRWLAQRGVVAIPKPVRPERMAE
jgi:diketogulonate reductase-like aldo/keto reductase